MKKFITELSKNIMGSFNNNQKEGFSARKLTAFTLILCIIFMHLIWGKNNNFTVEILICDLIGVAFFLGLITVDQIIRFKNDNKKEENE